MPHKTADPSAGMTEKQLTQMFQIFHNVQFNVVQHKKYVKELTKLYNKMDQDAFKENFSRALLYLFTFGDSDPNVDRVVQFIATFCASLDDEEFLRFIFETIFNCQCVAGQSVRYRASQLLAAVLAALGDNATLDDDLCDKLLSSQMERLQDTRGAVRCRAALALQRLQNPMDPEDPVTRAYRFHLSCDPSSSVRRAILTSIAKCSRNIPFVLERLCDVDEAVRRAAFIYIAAINVTQLKVRQRVHILKVGLTERSARVRRVVEEILVPGWLSTFNSNIIELLTAIRLDNPTGAKDSQTVAGKLLESLFKRLPVSELLEWLPTAKTLPVIPAEKLSKETAWYWRHLAEHLANIDDDETLEAVLPDLVFFVKYIRVFLEAPCPNEQTDPVGFNTRQYLLHELACMLRAYDAKDEAGRNELLQLLQDALTGDYEPLWEDTVRALVAALELALPDVTRRVEWVVSAVSELRQPVQIETRDTAPPPECPETKLKRARLRVSLNVAMEAQEEAAREQNYSLAAQCKEKVEQIQLQLDELAAPAQPPPQVIEKPCEKSTDPKVLNRCLQMINMTLDSAQITTVPPLLRVLFQEFEEDIFQSAELLESALKTVALFGVLDAEFAKEHKAFFFANIIDLTNESVVCTALKCICDLLCVHGLRLFDEDVTTAKQDNEDEDISLLLSASSEGAVVEVLLKAMDSQCGAYRLIVVEGLCRLLILGHMESATVLSRLMLLWFSPVTEEEDLLRQTIGVFFQSFAVSVDSAQEQIQQATLPTLKALANAPAHSPLAEIDHDSVIRFIVSLTRVQHEMSDSQGGMALLLVNHLVSERSKPVMALLCRCLSLLQPPREPQLAVDLAASLRRLPELPDKASARHIARYLGALEVVELTTKMSTVGTMATINEETTNEMENNESEMLGRATSSLPSHPPLARSTHVVVNETVDEEVEIDESSPEQQSDPANKTPNTRKDSKNKKLLSTSLRLRKDRLHSDNEHFRKHDEERRNSDGNSRVTLVRGSKIFDSPVVERPRSLDDDRRITLVRGSKVIDSPVVERQRRLDDDSMINLVRGSKVFDSPLSSLSDMDIEIPDTQEREESLGQSDSSESSSPRKKPRKGGKIAKKAPMKTPAKQKEGRSSGEDSEKGIKRTRSQRSIVDLDRGSNSPSSSTPASKSTTDRSNTETPKPKSKRNKIAPKTPSGEKLPSKASTESLKSGKSTSSKSSSSSGKSGKGSSEREPNPLPKGKGKATAKTKPVVRRTRSSIGRRSEVQSNEENENSADETELHTIIYDREIEQSFLPNSSDEENAGSKGNVTIPETPESSDRSTSSSPDMLRAPTRNKAKN